MILVFAVTVSILVNLVVFRRRRRKLGRVETSLGKILAAVGGFITLVATALPWATVTYSDIPGSYVFLGVAFFGYSSIIVYLFGLAWLTFFALPRKVYAILGLGWGSLALLLALLADAGVFPGGRPGANAAAIGSGVYLSLLGSIMLVVGSAFAYMEAKKVSARGPVEIAQPAPPMP